jgi:hypothetical protein
VDDPALDFAIDLGSVRRQVETLGYFNSVTDVQKATTAIEQLDAHPPAAFVSVSSEVAEKNRLATGLAQRVNVTISCLFAILSERADGRADDEMEAVRKAVIRILLGFTPDRALKPLEYDRYALRAAGDGLVWGEVLMRTSYDLRAV